jgi:hypothetical protein
MIEIAGGFQFHEFYVYPAAESELGAWQNKFYYFSTNPKPETDAQGRPSLMSIPMNAGGLLQLGAHLGLGSAENELLEVLRSELSVRLRLPDLAAQVGAGAPASAPGLEPKTPATLSLEPAPLQVKNAKLQLGNGSESAPVFVDLASSDTSGFFPFAALFSVQLNTAQQASVAAALNGRKGFLLVSYEAGLPIPVQGSSRMVGDLRGLQAELVAFVRSTPGATPEEDLLAAAGHLLDQAIEQGRVRRKGQSSAAAPKLQQRAFDNARRAMLDVVVAAVLREVHDPSGQAPPGSQDLARAETTANFTEMLIYPLHLVADVATWFGGGSLKGTDHIVLLPGN